MRDRTLAIIITIIVLFLLGVPGLACICLGLTSFLLYPFFNNQMRIAPAWINTAGASGLCAGVFLILITIVLCYFLLRERPGTSPEKPTKPLPPTGPATPLPPAAPPPPHASSTTSIPPAEPLPPASSTPSTPPPEEQKPAPPPGPDEPLPPTI